jgi:hypothetical protein
MTRTAAEQTEVWRAFAGQVRAGLAEHPEGSLAHLAVEFSPARTREAR